MLEWWISLQPRMRTTISELKSWDVTYQVPLPNYKPHHLCRGEIFPGQVNVYCRADQIYQVPWHSKNIGPSWMTKVRIVTFFSSQLPSLSRLHCFAWDHRALHSQKSISTANFIPGLDCMTTYVEKSRVEGVRGTTSILFHDSRLQQDTPLYPRSIPKNILFF